MTTIDEKLQKRALMIQEVRDVVETKNILSPVSTVARATAKNIYSPYTGVGAAKSHTSDCKVPITTQTLAKNELVLDRLIGNAIKDCKDELSYAKFNLIDMWRADLYASIIKKQNQLAVTDFVADATVVAGTEDLSTADLVREFLIGVKASADQVVGVKQRIDGATIERAAYHGKAFVACGQTAFVNITSKVASIVSQSSLKGIDGNFVETPFGVVIINLGTAADDAKRLLYGVAGVPLIAYRADEGAEGLQVDMGEMVSETTAAATDLDVTIGDAMLSKTWYMYAQTKGKNGIFANVAEHVSTRLMA